MDHSEATQMKAVERYTLGDLSVSEVEEFERHFFDCPQCSEELRTLTILQDNARAVYLETATPFPGSPREQSSSLSAASPPAREPIKARQAARAGRWSGFLWAPALAMLVIGVLAGYETGVRRSADFPQPISAHPLYAASRGEETVITPPAGAHFYSLYMDRTWDRDFPSYRAVIRDAAGGERYSMRVSAPSAAGSIYVLVPSSALAAGKYVVAILGVDAAGRETEVARFPFTLRFE